MTEKINKKSPDILEEKIWQIKKIFPDVFSESKIDFNKLKETLGDFIDHTDENYNFSWAGKIKAMQNISSPSKGTLIPEKDESVNFDSTENIFIEGENLEVLKLLKKSYSRKIKMIYIDPPYNLSGDFVYKDDFKNNLESYLEQTGQTNGGVKLTTNLETSGRFHSDWISFMYSRLSVSWELLEDDGVIFISIGQLELSNLIMICNLVFGEENKIGIISRQMKSGGNKGDHFSSNIDYVVVFAKNIELANNFRVPLEDEYANRLFTNIEEDGPRKGERFREMGLYQSSLDPLRGCTNQRYWIQCPDGSFVMPPGNITPKKIQDGEKIPPQTREDNVWRWSQTKYLLEKNKLVFKETKTSPLLNEKNKTSKWNVYTKIWLEDRQEAGRVPTDLMTKCENRHSAAELKELDIPFEYSKPSSMISSLCSYMSEKDFIVLDFFAGSGTTAHSIFNSNSNDGGTRKFILVQIPELCKSESLAKEKGFNTISEISKERIRRVIKKQISESKQTKLNNSNLDLGFKVFKLAKSNYKVWNDVKDVKKLQEQLKLFEEPLIEKYSDNDVLYEIILKEGYSLNSKIEEFLNNPNKIYKVIDRDIFFYITLDQKLDQKSIEKLNLDKNIMFVCLDSALDDSQKTNLDLQCKLRVI
jgi:adenine-specific DNA-methyltransferase